MLDVRVYRTAFLPALVAVFIAAFSLQDRPAPATSPLAADAFDGSRAFATLQDLARRFPDRRPGTAGDEALASEVAGQIAAPQRRGGPAAFEVRRTRTDGETAEGGGQLTTVVGTRPGLSPRRIVVLADRSAAAVPGVAALSGTAALLELARDFKGRDLTKTLVLVSTSGAPTGSAGARAWARATADGGPVDAVLVLGDLAGARLRKPFVVPWRSDAAPPPLALERTVQRALRREVGRNPGSARAGGQWARRAVPLTVSPQGPVGAAGLPAVLVSASGERGPSAREGVRGDRLEGFGRAVLSAVTAIDAAGSGGGTGPAFEPETGGVVTMRNVLPDWAVRLLVGTLLLPAWLAGLDAVFRARRRHAPVAAWVRWLALAAVPLLAARAWARVLGVTGIVGAPDAPVLPGGAFPLRAGGALALLSCVAAGFLAWAGLRRLAGGGRRLRGDGDPLGLGAAIALALCVLAGLAWLVNPYAAALLLPAAHGWLLLATRAAPVRRTIAAGVVLAGLLPPLLVLLHFATAFGLGPAGLPWAAFLAAAGGAAGLWSTLLLAGLLAALAGLVRLVRARGRAVTAAGPAAPVVRTRGPLTYAGPGSLGGTESALRR